MSEQRISKARFSACAGSHLRHSSIPTQCVPTEAFCFIVDEVSYEAIKKQASGKVLARFVCYTATKEVDQEVYSCMI